MHHCTTTPFIEPNIDQGVCKGGLIPDRAQPVTETWFTFPLLIGVVMDIHMESRNEIFDQGSNKQSALKNERFANCMNSERR